MFKHDTAAAERPTRAGAARRNGIHHSAHQVPYRASCVPSKAGDVLPICRIPDLIVTRERHRPPNLEQRSGAHVHIDPAPVSILASRVSCVTSRRSVGRRCAVPRNMQRELHSSSQSMGSPKIRHALAMTVAAVSRRIGRCDVSWISEAFGSGAFRRASSGWLGVAWRRVSKLG